jgi:chromosome segregation and condensation protein ScpB
MARTPRYKSLTPWKAHKNKEFRETIQIISLYQPLTRRELSFITPFEISTLCRILNHLTNRHGITKIAYTAKCATTGKPVAYYALRNWKDHKNGK